MQTTKNNMRLIGRREFVNFPLLGIFNVEAKVDTGAYTSSIHCDNINIVAENGKPILYFSINQLINHKEETKILRFENFTQKKIKNSFGELEERYVIKTLVNIGRKKIWSTLSLSNRESMRYPLLIGRKMLKGKFIIDIHKIHTGGISLQKVLK
jgi:hypothetical protein